MRRALACIASGTLAWTVSACVAFDSGQPRRYLDPVFDAVAVTRDIQYGAAPSRREPGQDEALRLDLYEPEGDGAPDRPAVVLVHGGAYVAGDKAVPAALAEDLARRGYVVASINYRLQPQAELSFALPWPEQTRAAATDAQHDTQAAVRWLRAEASAVRIAPERIGVVGISAGAMTALLVADNPDDPGSSGNPGSDSDVRSVGALMGCADPAMLDRPSPPPAQLQHGTTDTTVPLDCARATAQRWRALGGAVELVVVDDVGHELVVTRSDAVASKLAAFLDATLAPEPIPSEARR